MTDPTPQTDATDQTVAQSGPGFWTITLGVAAGILVAVALIWAGYSLIHADDELQCVRDRLNDTTVGEPAPTTRCPGD